MHLRPCSRCVRVRQGLVQPGLIVAMPVGFVAVVESKEQALTLDTPAITVRGGKAAAPSRLLPSMRCCSWHSKDYRHDECAARRGWLWTV